MLLFYKTQLLHKIVALISHLDYLLSQLFVRDALLVEDSQLLIMLILKAFLNTLNKDVFLA